VEGGVSVDRHIPLSGSTQVQDANRDSVELNADLSHPPLSGGHLWMHRLAVLLFVFFCAILGVILIIFPWRDEWTSNSLLFGHPGLQEFLSHGFVRGLCSGLGLLDIWIGFWEAIHYHE
jgi:hypothetical protein